jgi:hypothetical protein
MSKAACTHLTEIKITNTDEHVCEDCIKVGDSWLYLRMCLSCGHVGCCDSSKNKHATKLVRRIGLSADTFDRAGKTLDLVLRRFVRSPRIAAVKML